MNSDVSPTNTGVRPPGLEWLLAGVLQYGSWLASATIGVGLALAMIHGRAGTHDLAMAPKMRIVTIGIAGFILLPVVRVAVMLVVFLRQRDYRFGWIAALVLTILFGGFALGTRLAAVAER
ncbi:MAG TPA: DUF1634 domain-containing protein [Bryobacteraceae bacterium]|nr:DUF1634 domain-containing protein [Bryobacteraceae bacterium]